MEHPSPLATAGALPRIALRLMATTDVHMHILPVEDFERSPSLAMGLARTASLIRMARAEARNSLLFDNGDFLHGHPLAEEVFENVQQGRRESHGVHPIIAAMRAIGVDAITLGNHDFDHGAEFLGQVLARAPFPVVASNLALNPRRPGSGPRPMPATEPFTLLDRDFVDDAGARHRVRIGLLGFLPPGSITGLRGGPFRAEVRDIVDTARIMAPQLRALGADVVVALAHSGIGGEIHVPHMENALVPLAREVPEIDVIVGGHAHQVFPDASRHWPSQVDAEIGRICGTPVVIPGFWGSHLGLVDLTLRRGANGGWAPTDARAHLRPTLAIDPRNGDLRPTVAPDPHILKRLARLQTRLASRSRERIGATRRRLHSYFAAIAPAPAVDVVHRAQAWWATRALAGTPLAALPILSSSAAFKTGGLGGPGYYTDIKAGPLTRFDLNDLYLYPNTLCALRLTGKDLAEWLERAASVFNQIRPGGGDQALFSSSTPLYDFETVAGCSYRIDLSAPARYGAKGRLRAPGARRIRDLRRDGRTIQPTDEVLLLTNSFRVAGGGGYPTPPRDRLVLDTRTPLRDIIADYLRETGPYDEAPWADWEFSPLRSATGLFLSSPTAQDLARLHRGVTPGAIRPDGFQLYRLALSEPVSYIPAREVGAGKRLANPVRSGRKQP